MLTCDLRRVTATSVNVCNFRLCLSKWGIEFNGDVFFISLENNSSKRIHTIKIFFYIRNNLKFIIWKVDWNWNVMGLKTWTDQNLDFFVNTIFMEN